LWVSSLSSYCTFSWFNFLGASILSIFIAIQWATASVINGLQLERMPASVPFGITYAQTMGTVMMNLGCATIIPSWVNIKAMNVRAQSVMWATVTITALFYVSVGIFLALGFDSNNSNNSLQALLVAGKPATLCKVSVAMYSYVMLLPSVPINFTVSYQNLVQNNVCGKKLASFFTFIVPIIVAIPLQTRDYLFLFLTWTSLIFVSCSNFILPLVLYLKCVSFRKEFNAERILTFHQLKLLSTIHASSDEIGEYINSNTSLSTVPGSIMTASPSIILSPPTKDNESQQSSNVLLVSAKIGPPSPYSQSKSVLFKNSNFNILEFSRISMKPDNYEVTSSDQILPTSGDTRVSWIQRTVTSLSEFEKIGLKKPTSKEHYPAIDKLTYVDPNDVVMPMDWLEEDVPDPENISMEGSQDIPLETFESEQLGSQLSVPMTKSSGSLQSFSTTSSINSLPRDPKFRSPAFRAIPIWFPIKPYDLCIFLLVAASIISAGNIVVNGILSKVIK
jgi:hypothetical protein